MSTFHREWLLNLNISNEVFIENFYTIVQKGIPYLYFSSWFSMNNIEKDFYGIIRSETFTIWKRKGLLEIPSGELWAEIFPKEEGITIKMQISTKNVFYKGFLVSRIIWIAILLLLILPQTFLSLNLYTSSPIANTTTLVLFILAICIFAYQTIEKMIGRRLDKLQVLYTSLIKTLEASAVTNRLTEP